MSAWNQKWPAMSRAEKAEILRPLVQPTPDRDDPAFDEADAMANVADELHASRDIEEVLGDLADSAGLLAVLLEAPGLTGSQCHRLEMLARHAKNLEAKRDAEYRTLNGDPR